VIMRAPMDANLIGRNLASSPVFVRLATFPSGSFEDVGRIDGLERLFVFRHVAEYPLILSYNRATADIYAGWRSKAWQFGSIILALCAINLALVSFLIRLAKQRAEAQHNLAQMAATDSLTGLFNRRKLDDIFEQEWRRARGHEAIGLLMIDADGFKAYNDQFGHQAGDVALVAIADCIQRNARRAADVCARYGGEEFAVLLPGMTLSDALDRAESIRHAVLALRTDQQGRPDSTPTVSIGAASIIPRAGLQPRDLVKAADTALYEAKSKGRNRSEAATWLSPALPRFEAA
jgi:diguanylate cyclase (GGDEF)-like protein